MIIERGIIFMFLFGIAIGKSSINDLQIRVLHRGGILFECPHYSVTENALYWSDINGKKAYRMDLWNEVTTFRHIDHGAVSLIIPVKNRPKLLLLGVSKELHLMSWENDKKNASLKLITKLDSEYSDNRINDGKVDALGRVWFGTMGKEVDGVVDGNKSTLYMMDQYNYQQPVVKVSPVSISNGITWSKNNKFMFYVDSSTKEIEVFDFNLKDGDIKNRRTLFRFEANNITGVPDGMTIDTEDNLWVAACGGWKVLKIDSKTGRLLDTINFPTKRITSVMFGGSALSTLFVTSSSEGLSSEELRSQPDAGSLFAVEGTGSRGWAENQFKFPFAYKLLNDF